MKKESKRKVFVAAGALLLIGAVGATAGTTFAKYTNSANKGATSATVAKWGFTVSAKGELFGKMYGSDTKVAASGDNAVIVSSGDYNVVAPGSSGSVTFTINGTAEVNAKISVVIGNEDFQDISLSKEDSNPLDEEDDGFTYNPIKWTISKNGTTAAAALKENEDPETMLRGWANDSKEYKANSESVNLTYTLSWKWEFENGDDNEKDTILGSIANAKADNDDDELAKYADYTAVTELKIPSIKVSVEQIQDVIRTN